MNKNMSSKLSKIDPDNEESFERIFLTLDIAWADDEIIGDTIDKIEEADVEATWSIIHDSEYLAAL